MQLVADRFVKQDEGAAIDLATACPVWLSIDECGDERESRRWTARCDELQRLRHFALAPLLDYGPIAAAQRFEAWSGAGAWGGADEHAHRTAAFASAFLRSVSLTSGSESAYRIVHGERSAMAIAPSDAGYAIESGEDTGAADGVVPGIVPGVTLIDRPSVGALAEMFTTVNDRRPRVAALWGPPGSGLDTAVLVLARIARLHGFVPIDARLLDVYRTLVADRSLFIIERRPTRRLAPWLHALLRSSRPHVCLLAGSDEVRGVDGVALGRVSADTLVAAVRPAPAAERLARVQREAERALGLPARFARSLWPAPFVDRARRHTTGPSRVAERAVAYDRSEPFAAILDGLASVAAQPPRVWAFPGELARLRQQVQSATALLAAGRHAPGLRLLRQAAAGLARRDAWEDAARGELTLAESTRARGRPREALRVLEQARDHAMRCDDAGLLVDAAIAVGESWTDLARLDEAERVCRGALATARALGDPWRAGIAATGLARGLFWRGAYADAATLLAGDAHEPQTIPVAVRRLRLTARTRIADGATADALAALAEARDKASGHPRLLVDVEHTEAFVRARMGDLDGADRHVAACLAGAQRGRQPLRVLSARLIQTEADRRRGRVSGLAALEPLRRLAAAAPALIRARWDLLKALVETPGDRTVVDRIAARSGLQALRLFAQPEASAADPLADPFVEETLEILRVCQHADDEAALLAAVCARVRDHLHAASVAFVVARDGGRIETLASEGPRMDPQIAERAIAVGVTIAPHRVNERLEAASAVVYGGAAIGALCARWTVGGTDDLSRAPAVLSMASTAAAPVLSALLVRRSQLRPPAVHDLLGITPAMADLRRAVERAAAAPFAVLVEGESGSGKELVARAIHRGSARRDRAFCTLNCAALPDDLVEAELFGHARGAFTGAVVERQGVFEEAHGGTLFLDEIGELSLRAQAKILRVIQEGELRRVGENTARRIDVRIVSATNRDLRREVETARFRLDLLYRLDVVRITVPPLRERREDIAVLIDHFWLEIMRRTGGVATLAASTRAALAAYDWPGNIRELQNVLAGVAVRSAKRGVVHPSALPTHLAAGARRPASWRLDSARRTFEEAFVRAALVRSGGHRGRAAADLGVTRQGLTKLITRLGIGE